MTVVTVVTGKQHSQLKDNLLAVYPAMNCLSHPRHLRPNHVGYEVLVQQRLARCPQTFIGRNYIRARCDSNGPSASTASSTNIGSTIAAQGGSSLKDATRTTSVRCVLLNAAMFESCTCMGVSHTYTDALMVAGVCPHAACRLKTSSTCCNRCRHAVMQR